MKASYRPGDEVQILTVNDVRLSLPEKSFVAHYARSGAAYEPHVSSLIFAALKPGDTFVDVGANVGYYAVQAAKIVGPSGRVIAVEPDGQNCRCLNHSLALNALGNVTIWPVAAGERFEPLALLIDGASNSGTRDLDRVIEDTFSMVACIPLDLLLKDQASVDVIKVDVEAREHTVMLGAENILRKHRPLVFSEYTPSAMFDVGGRKPHEYLEFMFGLGYRASVIMPLDGGLLDCGKSPRKIDAALDDPAIKATGCNYLDLLFQS